MFSALMRATLHGFGTAHSSNPIEIKNVGSIGPKWYSISLTRGWSWKSTTVWLHALSALAMQTSSYRTTWLRLNEKPCVMSKWLKNVNAIWISQSSFSINSDYIIVIDRGWWLWTTIGIITINISAAYSRTCGHQPASWSKRPLPSVEWCDPGRCSCRLRGIRGRIWRCSSSSMVNWMFYTCTCTDSCSSTHIICMHVDR